MPPKTPDVVAANGRDGSLRIFGGLRLDLSLDLADWQTEDQIARLCSDLADEL
jgi:hypothetical protein